MANKEIKTEQAPAAIGPYSQGISAETSHLYQDSSQSILQQESLQVTTLQARHVSP